MASTDIILTWQPPGINAKTTPGPPRWPPKRARWPPYQPCPGTHTIPVRGAVFLSRTPGFLAEPASAGGGGGGQWEAPWGSWGRGEGEIEGGRVTSSWSPCRSPRSAGPR